jgi:hypothetical protein
VIPFRTNVRNIDEVRQALERIRLDRITPALNNWTASANPGLADDDTAGYSQGSWWYNLNGDSGDQWHLFLCIDATTGAADWVDVTAQGAIGGGLVNYGDLTTTASGLVCGTETNHTIDESVSIIMPDGSDGDLRFNDNINAAFGSSSDAKLRWNTGSGGYLQLEMVSDNWFVVDSTNSMKVPAGNSAAGIATNTGGYIRYDTDDKVLKVWIENDDGGIGESAFNIIPYRASTGMAATTSLLKYDNTNHRYTDSVPEWYFNNNNLVADDDIELGFGGDPSNPDSAFQQYTTGTKNVFALGLSSITASEYEMFVIGLRSTLDGTLDVTAQTSAGEPELRIYDSAGTSYVALVQNQLVDGNLVKYDTGVLTDSGIVASDLPYELSDLTDVDSATQTAGFVIQSLGANYAGRLQDATYVKFDDVTPSGTETVKEILDDTIHAGVLDAITITDEGGINISWTAGKVYTPAGNIVETTADASEACTDNAINYLIWASGTGLTLQTTPADATSEVSIGHIQVQDGDIWEVHTEPIVSVTVPAIQAGLGAILPVTVSSGIVVSEDVDATNAFDVSVSAGTYWHDAHDPHAVAQYDTRTADTLVRCYIDGAAPETWSFTAAQHSIDVANWNSGTSLVGTSASKYYRGMFIVSEDNVFWIYAQEQHNTLAAAIAGDNPSPPLGISLFPTSIAYIYQHGDTAFDTAGSNRWIDIRPRINTAVPGSVTSHDSLADVSADDHHAQDHAATHADGAGDAVDHDTLTNFVANEHIDHSTVTLTAGAGLAGGGTIAANRTFSVNVDDSTIEIPVDTLQVKDDGITYAKIQNVVADDVLLGNVSGAGAIVAELDATTVRTLLNVEDGANAYTHPNHSGDVTSVADGATTIADEAVTYAKMQHVSDTDRFLGRDTAGAGDVEEITAAAARAILNVADGANAYTHPNHSGDVTSVADGAQTIASDAVTNAKLNNMAANTVKCRYTASTGDPQDATATELTEEETPASGDFLLGWESGGAIRKFDVGDLPTGGGGEANTGSNIGTDGVGVFDQKSGVDLQFRHVASTNALITVALDAGDNDIDFTLNEASIDHDNLTNFLADEHVAHSGVSILEGDGIVVTDATIADNVTVAFDIDAIGSGTSTIAGADEFVLSNAGTNKVISWTNLLTQISLDDLSDVVLTPAFGDNDLIAYHIGDSKWINQSAADAGLSELGHEHTESDISVSQTDVLLGRDTAGAGAVEEISVTGGIQFSGGGQIYRSALTGDVTASAGSGVTTTARFQGKTLTLTVPAEGEFIRMNGADTWVNAAITEADISDLGTYVLHSLFDAHTMLYATADDTPLALTVAANSLVGRAAGNIDSLIYTDVTEEGSPAALDWVLGWLADGSLRKYDIGNLPGGGGGETNTASNLGGGVGVYETKVGVDLQFNSLVGATGITISEDDGNDEIDIAVAFGDDEVLGFGAPNAGILWETQGNDYLAIATALGAAGNSGYVSILEYADIGDADRSPSGTATDPTLRIYSADADQADDYIEFSHNQANAVIGWGNGYLILDGPVNVPDDQFIWFGTTGAVDAQIGWEVGATNSFLFIGTELNSAAQSGYICIGEAGESASCEPAGIVSTPTLRLWDASHAADDWFDFYRTGTASYIDWGSGILDLEGGNVEVSAGDLTASGDIEAGKTIGYDAIVTNESVAGACTVDWADGNVQTITLDEATTITFSDPPNTCVLHLRVIQDSSTAYDITWSSVDKWVSGGTTPVVTTTLDGFDWFHFMFETGSNTYDGWQSSNFATPS